jgi:hypothetical protein
MKYLGIIKPGTKVLHMYKMFIAIVLRMKENKIFYSILFLTIEAHPVPYYWRG